MYLHLIRTCAALSEERTLAALAWRSNPQCHRPGALVLPGAHPRPDGAFTKSRAITPPPNQYDLATLRGNRAQERGRSTTVTDRQIPTQP